MGLEHINRPERLRDIRSSGYKDGVDMSDDIARSFSEIWDGKNGSLILVKRIPNSSGEQIGALYVKIEPSTEGWSYEIKSGGTFRPQHFEGGKGIIWKR